MNKSIMKNVLVFLGLAAACLFPARAVFANAIQSLSVEPTFECAGVIANLSGTDDPGQVSLEVKETGEPQFHPAHEFIRFDNAHMATSLFDLKPGTSYDIRATLGGRSVTGSFTTRPEFALPAPVRTIPVTTSSQLSAAINAAQPGDEIVLAPGTYSGGITVTRSGTAQNPIVIRGAVSAAEKAKPVDQRSGLPVINGSGRDEVITVTGNYVVIDSLRLENVSLRGIHFEANNHCVAQNNQIIGTSTGWNHFMYVSGGNAASGRHLIQGNYLQDSGAGGGYGIYQNEKPGPGTVIRRNILSGFYDGINASGSETEMTDASIPENHPDILGTWPNHSTDIYENIVRISRDDDIETDGVAVNMRVFRNQLSTGAGDYCTNTISIAPVAPGPFFFVRNVVSNSREGGVKYNTASNRGLTRNCYFYHNTFKNDLGTERRGTLLTLWIGTSDGGARSKNTYFKNNIFVGDQMLVQRLFTGHTPDYNPNYWFTRRTSGTLYQWGQNGPYYETFDAWQQATGEEKNGYYGDPLVDATFHLAAASPAIDKGARIPGINDAFAGSAPDMGAYETGTVPIANNTGPGSTIVPPAAVNTFAVSGYARTSALTAISGATITLAGDASRSAVSDANGFYQFANLASGSYTLTITRQGYVFDPGIRKLTLSANPASQDFTGISAQPSGDTIPENLNSARSFPNPWQAGNPYSPVVRFMNLTPKTKILIFTMVGDLVKEFSPEDRTEIQWDVAGENIASGVYVCLMTNDKGETKRQKIAIIR